MFKNVAVVLRSEPGKILLQFRDGQAPRYPLTWSFFGGGVADSEDPLAAAIRELKEELTLDVKREDCCLRCEFEHDERVMYFFDYSRPVAWGEFILNEGAGVGFFTPPEMRRLILTPIAQRFCTEYL